MNKIIVRSLAFSLLIVAGCKTGDAGDPKAVLVKFFDAIAKKDIQEAKKYITADSEGMMSLVEMGMKGMSGKEDGMLNYEKGNIEAGTAIIDGDKAIVPIKDKKSGEITDFTLRKESGSWKVAFDKSTLMEMAQKKMKEHNLGNMRKDMNDSMPGTDSMRREDLQRAEEIADSVMKK